MNLTLSKGEMLERVRLAGCLEHLRTDFSLESADGLSLDRLLEEQLRRRYTEHLLYGPEEQQVVRECAAELMCARVHLSLGRCILSDDCVRLLSVTMPGWERPAVVEPPSSLDNLLSCLDNEYTQPECSNPRAVMSPDGRSVYVAPYESGLRPTAARGILDPGPESYVLREEALSAIINSIKIQEL